MFSVDHVLVLRMHIVLSVMPRPLQSIRLAGDNMANVKKGTLTRPPQWWKHLRDWKRIFWKSERSAQKKDVKERSNE
jgi:hypothetical protein